MASTLARFESSGCFYLWGQLETHAYAAPVDSEEACHHHIVVGCQAI
jgi:hypothetical protein